MKESAAANSAKFSGRSGIMFTVKRPTLADQLSTARVEAVQKLRERVNATQPFVARLRTVAEQFERTQLDPLLDRALDLWSGATAAKQRQQRQALAMPLPRPPLTPEERS